MVYNIKEVQKNCQELFNKLGGAYRGFAMENAKMHVHWDKRSRFTSINIVDQLEQRYSAIQQNPDNPAELATYIQSIQVAATYLINENKTGKIERVELIGKHVDHLNNFLQREAHKQLINDIDQPKHTNSKNYHAKSERASHRTSTPTDQKSQLSTQSSKPPSLVESFKSSIKDLFNSIEKFVNSVKETLGIKPK